MAEILNEKILKKLKEFTENNNEFMMCKKILELENKFSDDIKPDFQDQYKKYLKDYFPYDEES